MSTSNSIRRSSRRAAAKGTRTRNSSDSELKPTTATRIPSIQKLLEDGDEITDVSIRRSTQTMEDSRSRKRDATVSPGSSTETLVPSDDTAGGKAAKKARKTVTFDGSTGVQSESDSRLRAASMREERSRRRDKKGAFIRGGGKGAPKKGEEADVVRVPMLTGTLLLYRGAKPRAVFVRRV